MKPDELTAVLEQQALVDAAFSEEEGEEPVGLSDDELRNICEQEFEAGTPGEEVTKDRKLALRQYFLQPDGNEEDGLSKVQSSDVRDAIESAMPILMDMFLSSESPVVFRPNGANDLDQADQETVFCQHVLNTQNPGLLLIYRWFKDALLFKNGYIKVYWDAAVDEEREDYDGLTEDEYAHLLSDESYEVIEAAVREAETQDPATGQPMPAKVYDVAGKRKSDAGQVRIINIPADRVRISAGWPEVSPSKAPYTCHGPELRSKSDLLVDGYDPGLVESLPTYQGGYDDTDDLNMSRRRDEQGLPVTGDVSRDMVEVFEHYIRADRNGDGIAELLQVVTAGRSSGTVLSITEVDANPILSACGYVLPHSHYGMSLAEIVSETQKVKTAILRQTLNNLYLSNLPGLEVDVNRVNNPEALAGPRVGMMLFKNGAEPVTTPVAVPFMAAQSLTVLQTVDEMAERKTGLSPESTGLDATSLAEATNMVGAMTLNQAQLRMKLLVSMLVETGVRPLMLRIRELVMKHMTREEMVLLGGKWASVNPREWREKRNTQLRIGLGTVQKQERVGVLQQVLALQQSIVQQQQGINGPFVQPQNIYNTLSEMERLTGHMGTDRYFSNPANWNPPPPQEDIASEALQIEEAKMTVDANNKAAEIELKARELRIKERQVEIQEAELGIKAQAEQNRAQESKEAREDRRVQAAVAASQKPASRPSSVKQKYGLS